MELAWKDFLFRDYNSLCNLNSTCKATGIMTLDILFSLEIIETMENYISKVRPKPEIRNRLDIAYEIIGQSIILNEVRPRWNNPEEIFSSGYAKATYVKQKNIWKVFWKRADNKWHAYEPQPTVLQLDEFLKLVDQDKYACFKG